jgi:hypothetical protein
VLQADRITQSASTVIRLGRDVWRREYQPWLGIAADLTCERTVGGKVNGGILGEFACRAQVLDLCFCGPVAKPDGLR